MKVAGSAYLLYLAWQVAHAGAIEAGVLARPMGLASAAAFQLVNPKAWIFALGAVTTFRPAELSPLVGTAVVALTMALVILPTASIWAGGRRRHRAARDLAEDEAGGQPRARRDGRGERRARLDLAAGLPRGPTMG